MSPRTRFLPALLVLALACVTNHARAQRYLLKDNSVIPANAATLRDGQLIATANFAGGGVFERRIALGDIARLDFPIPDGLAEAEAALLAGNHARAWTTGGASFTISSIISAATSGWPLRATISARAM